MMEKWYEKEGEAASLVVSSRIRLARNLADYPFPAHLSEEQAKEINQKVYEALQKVSFGENTLHLLKMEELTPVQRQSLVERHSVSPDFAASPNGRMLLLSEDESIAVMVNEEDHLRIQVLLSGLLPQNAYEICNRIDDVLDESLSYAFDETLGYLTSCPTNLGTGMRASVMMHLPALEKSGLISQLANTVSKLGLTIRGTYGEGSNAVGALYQISNQITLGITEQDSIQNLIGVVGQIIESEQKAAKVLMEQQPELEDELFRSFGVLKYARVLSGKEFYHHLSNLRLAAAVGLIELPYTVLNRLMQQVGAATVCLAQTEVLPPKMRDRERARIVREALSSYHAD